MMVGRLSSEVEYQEFIELATQYSELRSAYVADKQKNRTGTTHSCETKDKISKSHLGVPMSDEARKKMSENHVDVNGKNNPAFGRHWYNNGVNRLYLKDTEEIPEGYIRGNLPLTEEDKKRKSESNKGKHGQSKGSHWYNNGEYEIMAFECPEGFVKGRLKK